MIKLLLLLFPLIISCVDPKKTSDAQTSSVLGPGFGTSTKPAAQTGSTSQSSSTNQQSSSSSSIDCSGKGLWEFGDKFRLGSLADESTPFIVGSPAGNCHFEPNEQKEIVENMLQGTTKSANPTAIFTIGGPGCGKSSSLDKTIEKLGLKKSEFLKIDPDDLRTKVKAFKDATNIKSQLCPGKKRAYAGATLWCLDHGRDLKFDLLFEAWAKKLNFIFDSACEDSHHCEDLIKKAAQAGFTIYITAVWASLKKCQERAMERAFMNGRYAAPSYITKAHNMVGQQKGLLRLIKRAENTGGRAFVYDNDGAEVQLIFEGNDPSACPKEQPACSYFFNK